MNTNGGLLILHLSDLHFGNHNRFAEQDLGKLGKAFFRAVQHARAQAGIQGKIQLVIVSGDLAEVGKPKEFEQAEYSSMPCPGKSGWTISIRLRAGQSRFVVATVQEGSRRPGNRRLRRCRTPPPNGCRQIPVLRRDARSHLREATRRGTRPPTAGGWGLAARFSRIASLGRGIEHVRIGVTSAGGPSRTSEPAAGRGADGHVAARSVSRLAQDRRCPPQPRSPPRRRTSRTGRGS